MLFKAIIAKFAEIHFQKGENMADNVRRICKEQGKQLKDLAEEIRINPASLTRAVYGNARLETIEKIAAGLSVSVKSLFEQKDDVEGFIRVQGKNYYFNSRSELVDLLNKLNIGKNEG